MTEQRSDQVCSSYTPNFWKKNICRNCFQTEDQHLDNKTKSSGISSPPSGINQQPLSIAQLNLNSREDGDQYPVGDSDSRNSLTGNIRCDTTATSLVVPNENFWPTLSTYKKFNSKGEGHRFFDVHREPQISSQQSVGYQDIPLLPLDIAVEGLEYHGIVPNISHNALMAKELSPSPTNGLTVDESAAIHLYTMEWQPMNRSLHAQLNAALRSNDLNQLTHFLPYLRLFFTALSKLPSVSMTVWRGMKGDLSNEYPTDEVFVWRAFSSCTTKLDILQSDQFLGNSATRTLFNVECHSGKDIRAHSHFPNENEVLLLPATQFRIVGKLRPTPGVCIVHVIEIVSSHPSLEATFPLSASTPSNIKATNAASASYLKEKPQTPLDSSENVSVIAQTSSVKSVRPHQARASSKKKSDFAVVPLDSSQLSPQALQRNQVEAIVGEKNFVNTRKTSTKRVSSTISQKSEMSRTIKPVNQDTTALGTAPDWDMKLQKSSSKLGVLLQEDKTLRNDQLPICHNSELSEFILLNRTATRISFSGRNLDKEDAKFVIEELEVNVDWKWIFLSENNFDAQIAEYLADALASKSIVQGLSLDHNRLSDSGISHLAVSLHFNRVLTDLRLASNGITNIGAIQLASMLYDNKTLEKLCLNGNRIGDEGMAAITQALKKNQVLRELYMVSNEITDKSVKSIVALIEKNDALEFIDLRNNHISEEGNVAIEMTCERLDRLRGESLFGIEKQLLQITNLENEIRAMVAELFETMTARILLEHQVQSLEEQLSFLRQVHDVEMKMIQDNSISIDVTAFYRTELLRAISDIKCDFEALSQAQRRELEEYYRIKTEEIQMEILVNTKAEATNTFEQLCAELYTSLHTNMAEINSLNNECNIKSENIAALESNLKNLKQENKIKIDRLEHETRQLQIRMEEIMNLKLKADSKKAGLQLEINIYRRLIKKPMN